MQLLPVNSSIQIPATHSYSVIDALTFEQACAEFRRRHPTYTPPVVYQYRSQYWFQMAYVPAFQRYPMLQNRLP